MDKGLITHAVLTNDEGQVLVIKRKPDDRVLPGYWDIPGGTLEDGEDPAAGVIRETQEETGLNIDNPRLFHFTANVDTGKNKQFFRLIFRAHAPAGEIRLEPDEHTEYKWIDPANPLDLPYVDYLPDCFKLLTA